MLSRVAFAVLTFALFACGASIDPAMKASVDAKLAALQPQSTTYPTPTAELPPPLVPGQWIRLKMTDSKGRLAIITDKIVGKEGNATWLEVVHESYTGHSIIKMLADFGDRTDPDKVDIQNIIIKNGDKAPIDYSKQGPVLAMVKGMYKSVVKNLIIQWHGLPKETKSTLAGTFTDCFKGKSEVSLGPITSSGTVWYHPAVPINGTVAFTGDQGDVEELIGFGDTGAVSEL
jgi:hypothetical protein